MSNPSIAAFFAKASEDEELQQEYLQTLAAATQAAVVALAAKHGFTFTGQELVDAWAGQEGELSDDLLDAVAGGFVPSLRRVEVSSQMLDVFGAAGLFNFAGGAERMLKRPQ